MLGWMCPDGTQYRQGSPDAHDATRCGVLVQDGQDAGSRLGRSGLNTTGSDNGHLFADGTCFNSGESGHMANECPKKEVKTNYVRLSEEGRDSRKGAYEPDRDSTE